MKKYDDWNVGELLYFNGIVYYIIVASVQRTRTLALGVCTESNVANSVSEKDNLHKSCKIYTIKPHINK